MYKYFVPDDSEPDGGRIRLVSDKVPSAHSWGDIVPLYNKDGKFITRFESLLSFYYYSN